MAMCCKRLWKLLVALKARRVDDAVTGRMDQIYGDGELVREATAKKFRSPQQARKML